MPSEKRQRQKEREHAAREARLAQQKRRQQRKTFATIGGLVLFVIALAALYSVLGGDDDGDADDEGAAPTTVEQAEPVECPPEDGSADPRLDFPAPPPDCLEEGATYEAVFDTTEGEMRVALDTTATPNTVNNFVYLARYGYYDGVEVFRSSTGIDIIQSGAPTTNSGSDPGPGYRLEDEGDGYTYEPGDLIMARGSGPNSAGAQFFFSTGPNTSELGAGTPRPDAGTYVKFGRVTEGMEVLEAIMANHVDDPAGAGTGEGAPDPIPVINSVTIVQS